MFKIDSPLMNFLNKMADIMILNILFVIFCIPIITIGASFSAAYYIAYKMVKDEESYIIKGFWKAFKENFRQATIMWIMTLAAMIIIFLDYRIIFYSGMVFPQWMIICMGTVTLVVFMMVVYIFALQAHYANPIKNTIKNSVLTALAHLPTTFALIAIYAVPVIICYFLPGAFITLFFISFGAIIYFKSILLLRIFRKYDEVIINNEKETAEGTDDRNGEIFAERECIEHEKTDTVDEKDASKKVFRDGRFIELPENNGSDSEVEQK